MKSITSLEKNGYLIIDNPDLNTDYKISNINHTIGSGERALYFGELQIYNTLRVEGELNILMGTSYSFILNNNITENKNIYGPIIVDGNIDIGAELTIL